MTMRIIGLILLLLPFLFVSVGDAQAKSKSSLLLPQVRPVLANYDVYVGGIHLLTAEFMFQQTATKYHIQAHIQTQGFWHRLLPWDTWFASDGKITGARFEPSLHKNVNVWKDNEPKTVALIFDKKRNVVAEFMPPEGPDDNREIVTAAQSRNVLDPLSGVLQLLGNLAYRKSCKATERVFDGKRVFDMIAVDQPASTTDPDEYGMYKGRARRCDVGFQMVAGSWKDREHSGFWKSADGKKDGSREPFQIWLTSLAPGLPEIGVRLESPSIWGRIVVHLTGWHYASEDDIKPYAIMSPKQHSPAQAMPAAAPKNLE